MCLAIPCKVLKAKENSRAEIEIAGARQEISLELFPEVEAGDWVLVNLGVVVAKIDEDEAKEIVALYREIAETETLQDGSPTVAGLRERGEWT